MGSIPPELRGVSATRTDADIPHLDFCVGRIVKRYWEGYGTFLGMVKRRVPTRPVVEVNYEDGDEEELYLDQVMLVLMPEGTLPPAAAQDPNATKYGYVWPPPTTSHRLVCTGDRARKPSAAAMQRELLAAARQWEIEEAKQRKIQRDELRAKKLAEKQANAASKAAAKRDKLATISKSNGKQVRKTPKAKSSTKQFATLNATAHSIEGNPISATKAKLKSKQSSRSDKLKGNNRGKKTSVQAKPTIITQKIPSASKANPTTAEVPINAMEFGAPFFYSNMNT